MELGIGSLVGRRFEIVRDVARGGMGRVYQARDRADGSIVALKVVLDAASDEAERFMREVRMLAEIRHPAIVRYVDHGVLEDGTPYLAMEWLEGLDVARALSLVRDERMTAARHRTGAAPAHAPSVALRIDDAVVVGARIASALSELASRGVVHRDLKPHNVMLPGGDARRATLIDFGTARLRQEPSSLTHTGHIVGTPAHMAPEQAEGDEQVGPAADVFALGVLLYEMLTGSPPFVAEHVVALLAKIVLAEPVDVRSVRRDVPNDLGELVHACLRKAPEERPTAAEVERRLDAMARVSTVRPLRSERPPGETVGRDERRARAIVLLGPGLTHEDTAALRELVADLRGEAKELVDGARVVRFATDDGTLPDRAAIAARVALACRARWPEVSAAVVSGRLDADAPIGPLLDRAGSLLSTRNESGVATDLETAALLETRFVLGPRVHGTVRVLGERAAPAPARTLLGRASPWVGRDKELAFLDGMLDEVIDESRAGGALVVGDPGLGKSRLRHEWIERARSAHPSLRVLVAHADALAAGAPFALMRDAIARASGMLAHDARDERRRKLRSLAALVPEAQRARTFAVFAELTALATDEDDPHLVSARRDPMLMGDAIRGAVEAWLEAEVERAPVLLVLEDLHWGDLPSVRTIDGALRLLRERPFALLATARPEVRRTFPNAFAGRGVQELELGALGKRAAERLVRDALGDDVAEERVAQLVARAQGNAFFLEELVRTADDANADTLPDSVLGVVEARLDALGTTARRVLRGASVFGETFEPDAVVSLLEGDLERRDALEWLEALVDREVLARPRDRGAATLSFRHALVREAAYAMLVERDRKRAHARAAVWLERTGRTDPLLLAHHWRESDTPERAVAPLVEAARKALEGNDFDAVHRHAETAIALGAEGTARGELDALVASAMYWQSRYEPSRARAEIAREHLPVGSSRYFLALGDEAVCSARLGDPTGLERAVRLAREVPHDGTKDGFEARIVCLCRAAFQIVFAGRFADADALLDSIDGLVVDESLLRDQTRAQWHHVRGVRAAHAGDVATFFRFLAQAIDAFERAGDVRNVALESPTLGWCWVEVSDLVRAESVLHDAIARCERLGADQATTYALVNLGYALAMGERTDDALRVLGDAIDRCERAANPRLGGWALAHRADLRRRLGDLGQAADDAERAVRQLAASPGLCAWARAVVSRVAFARGDLGLARASSLAAQETLDALGGLLQHEAMVPLALLEAHGDEAGAARIAHEARARLAGRAGRFDDPVLRDGFLATPTHRELRALCERYGAPAPERT